MADDVLALMDGARPRARHLVGHAAGGGDRPGARARARPSGSTGWSWSTAGREGRPAFPPLLRRPARAAPRQRASRPIVRAQPIFLYPARWISRAYRTAGSRGSRRTVAHFQGADNVEARIAALARLRYRRPARRASRRRSLLIAAADDMLVPDSCSDACRRAARMPRLDVMLGRPRLQRHRAGRVRQRFSRLARRRRSERGVE